MLAPDERSARMGRSRRFQTSFMAATPILIESLFLPCALHPLDKESILSIHQ